jgi:hypothetical protein
LPATNKPMIAIIYPGDHETRRKATPENNRLASIFQAFADLGLEAHPAVYHDSFCNEVRQQVMAMDGVLVWHNPIQDGRDRSRLDAMLREVAEAGVMVSTHPEVILKMGTKEVLYQTRHLGWGSDVHLYGDQDQMRRELPHRLAKGPRVLKQYRGHSGDGVWKLELIEPASVVSPQTIIWARQAKKGSVAVKISLAEFMERCRPYFTGQVRMIDQAYQERLPDGMLRCYMVVDQVAGFGHQAVNGLYPPPSGSDPSQAPPPGPRLYYPADYPPGQQLKGLVEGKWVPEMLQTLDISTHSLPLIWDCDFLFGPRDGSGQDTYVLCEINVSSIAPYPESVTAPLAMAALERIQAGK